jgi:hypothetical protein
MTRELLREVAMSASSAGPVLPAAGDPVLSVEEHIEASGAQKIRSIEDLQALAVDLFESDEELDEFLEFTYASRRHQEVFD